MSQNYKEIRLDFDRYITGLLKSWTRKKRTSSNGTRHHLSGNTNIANISLKQLLSHVETRQQLTVCFSEYFISEFEQ